MLEAWLVFGAVGTLAAAAWLGPLVPATAWVGAGACCTAAGLLVGIPTGLWYHVRLRACLAPRGLLPPRWWIRPAALHGRLAPDERRGVLLWFAVGGAGFVLTLLGCVLVVLGVGLEALRAGR